MHILYVLLGSPWIPLLLLAATTLFARSQGGSWLAPSAFGPALWVVYIFLPLVLGPELGVSGLAVWTILALVLCIQAGAMLGEHAPCQRATEAMVGRRAQGQLLCWSVLFACLASLGVVIFAWQALQKYDLPASPIGFLALGHAVSVARYSGEQEPILVRLLWAWVFPSALLGGVAVAIGGGRRRRSLGFAALLPALLYSAAETTRASLLIPAWCWMAGYFAMKVYLTKASYRLFNRKLLLALLAFAIFATGVYLALAAVRVFTIQEGLQTEPDWAEVRANFFGYLSPFSRWIPEEHSASIGLGAYTFAGLADLAGLHGRSVGIYDTHVAVGQGQETNIYTAFRGFIQDFSFPGAVLLCFLIGVLAGSAYRRAAEGQRMWVLPLAAYYAFLFWSPVVFLFTENGAVLAWAVGTVILARLSPDPAPGALLRRHAPQARVA